MVETQTKQSNAKCWCNEVPLRSESNFHLLLRLVLFLKNKQAEFSDLALQCKEYFEVTG